MYIGHRRGHNFKTVGAEGIIKEVESCDKIHNCVDRQLNDLGEHHINLNPPNDYGKDDVIFTVNNANKKGVDLYFSIHENKFNTIANGVEVWVYDKSFPEAERVLQNLVKLGFKNRGVKSMVKEKRELHELKATKMKAMIIEVCFCDNQQDVNLLNRVSHETVAKAIVEGVTNRKIDNTTNEKKGVYQVVTESFGVKQYAIDYQNKLKEKGINSFLQYKEV